MNAEATHRALCTSIAAIIFCACSLAFAEKDPPPEIPIQQWLQGPDHRDFDWKVTVWPPILTFHQRHLQTIQTTLSVGKLMKAEVSLSDLYFVVKVADANGKWYPGQSYSRFEPPPALGTGDQINSFAGIYLRPGKYTAAVMAYDVFHHRGNLSRSNFEILVVKDDPLPDMDRDLPQIDFLPSAEPPEHSGPVHIEIVTNPHRPNDWTFGEGTLRLPVDNETPLVLDVVADFPPSFVVPRRGYHWNAALLLQISKVLSQVNLKNGCVRFSAIRILDQKMYLHDEDARKVDWANLQEVLEKAERDAKAMHSTVDVGTLTARKPDSYRYEKFMEQALAGTSTCDGGKQMTRHVVIVVSDALPSFREMVTAPVQAQSLPAAEYYHVELDQTVTGPRSDDVEGLLKSLHPVQFRLKNATQFRQALAHVISDIEKTSHGGVLSTTH